MNTNQSIRLASFKRASLKFLLTSLLFGHMAFLGAEESVTAAPGEENTPTTQLAAGKPSFTDTLKEKDSGTNIKSFNFPLKDFMPNPEPIVLRKANDQYAIYFPVSNRMNVTFAELNLKFVNSISLLQERSQLRIKLNGITVGQLHLRSDQPEVNATIELPAELITNGFNNLTIWVAQHYTLECEDPAAPELWTEIDTFKSELVLTGELQPVDIMLSQLEQVMGPAIGNPQSYRILMPDGYNEQHVGVGALISESIGLRHFYRSPLFISDTAKVATEETDDSPVFNDLPGLDQKSLTGSDNVLFGTREELKPYLSDNTLNEIQDAYLGIFPLASDPRYFVLVVSGTTQEELKRAATALNFTHFPYTDSKTTLIKSTNIPASSRFGRKRYIKTDRLYTFDELGFKTTTVQGAGYHEYELSFELPADFYAAEDATVNLLLDFSYGARIRNDSVLNIKLNNSFERVIAIEDPEGAVFKGYVIKIPLRSFKPGKNRILFEPSLIPSVGGECIAVNDRNLVLTIYGSSVIKLPFATTYVSLPNLKLFSDTTFPFRRDGKAEPMTVSLLSSDHQTIAAAWTLMAKLAQTADGPMINAEFSYTIPEDDRELIVISPFDNLDEKIMSSAPLKFDGTSNYPYPISQQLEGIVAENSFISLVKDLFGKKKEVVDKPFQAHIQQTVRPHEHGMVMAYESPNHKKRSVVLFTAESGTKLHRYMEAIVQPSLWGKLSGDVALWTDEPKTIDTQSIAKKYFIGDASSREKARFQISENPWWWIIGVFLLIFLLAWISRILLNRRFRQRHRANVKIED